MSNMLPRLSEDELREYEVGRDALESAGINVMDDPDGAAVFRLIDEVRSRRNLTRAAMAARLTEEVLNKAMHAHDFARPESSGFDEMRHVLLDAVTGAGEET
jgi:hypothetical protein